jgi:putrescine aminotransferase
VLLIADEVVTGFGRTGKMFGTRLWDVNADIWCLAKGISSGYVPLGATVLNKKVTDAFEQGDSSLATVTHGYTYSAHPVAAAAALATLDFLANNDVVGNAAREGAYFMERLRAIGQAHRLVGDVRGVGLMGCLELVADRATKATFPRGAPEVGEVARQAYQRGAMIRTSGANIILSPALTIERVQIDMLCDALDAALTAVER